VGTNVQWNSTPKTWHSFLEHTFVGLEAAHHNFQTCILGIIWKTGNEAVGAQTKMEKLIKTKFLLR